MPRTAIARGAPLRVDGPDAGQHPAFNLETTRRVAERLRAELGELVHCFPVERRKISEMARWLGVSRPVCQRIVQAVRQPGDPLQSLRELPGVQGVASFIEAARDAGCEAQAVAAAQSAAVQYADLVDQHGGSQTRLLSAVERFLSRTDPSRATARTPRTEPLPEALRARRQIFEGASAITGRTVTEQLGLFLYRPTAESAEKIDCLTALSLSGVQMREDAMPLSPVSIFAQGDPDSAPDTLPIAPLERADASGIPIGAIEQFCSDPPPRIIARRRGGRVAVLIERDKDKHAPFDVALGAAFRGVPHPALHQPRIQNCFLHTDSPVLRLTLTVFLHRALATRCVATSGAYVRDRVGSRVPGPEGRVHVLTPDELWTVRLPDPPRLEYLGLGLDRVDGPDDARQRALAEHLFGMEGWDPGDFVGYSIKVDCPVWNAQYVVNFEFADADTGSD